MLTKLTGGKVYDPAHGINGEVRDIFVRDGRIVAHHQVDGDLPDQEFDCRGKVIMAGAIDMHTHIGGGKVTIARNLLPEDHRGDPVARSGPMRDIVSTIQPWSARIVFHALVLIRNEAKNGATTSTSIRAFQRPALNAMK